jgi:hypothetical protein
MCMVLDDFHAPENKADAEAWQKTNDEGSLKYFSPQDMRFLWGSWGSYDLNSVWSYYYDQATYEKIQTARKHADPNGVFTPNTFAVKCAE